MKNIILFGPPGSGKGTQGEKLKERFGLVHISTGDILRNEVAQGTVLGIEVKSLMDAGVLVPDSLVTSILKEQIVVHQSDTSSKNGFLFDGFPRTKAQCEALDNLLTKMGLSIDKVISLEVSTNELVQRLLRRGKESNRADDHNLQVIESRIEEYNNKTTAVLLHYEQQRKVARVSGTGNIDDIFNQICKVL